MNAVQLKPFLRVPPFPGARASSFVGASRAPTASADMAIEELVAEVRRSRVGGDYWAKQPPLPPSPYTLVKLSRPDQELPDHSDDSVLVWTERAADRPIHAVSGECDPWHLLSNAKEVVVHADDELALIAAIAGVPVTCVGDGRFSSLADGKGSAVETAFRECVVDEIAYADPFTGEPTVVADAIRLCGFWRALVDSNRDISAAFGFAFWKRPTVAPLLWNGTGEVVFASSTKLVQNGDKIAVWKSRTPAQLVEALEGEGAALIEVEDGFIRSAGLGSDCVPPLSIVVDRLGAHFDPSGPSELEELLQNGRFGPEILDRARELRRLIVASGVSKYGAASASLERRDSGRRLVLVPGQVEDDRAVLCDGNPVTSNLDLLRRVRTHEPEAHIIYKPHPDVEAGHRAGAIPEAECLAAADEIVRDQPISALIDLVDEVHVISSLAGFEALLRGKPVTTHGVPFYAGWGLTRDLGPVPDRRTARRSLDELVAAVLLLYPRYLDPLTGLPCPPEILVRRIAEGAAAQQGGVVVQLRRLQGRWKKRLAGLGS